MVLGVLFSMVLYHRKISNNIIMNISRVIASAGTKKKGPQSRRNAIVAGACGTSVEVGGAASLGHVSQSASATPKSSSHVHVRRQKRDASENSEPAGI